MSSFTAVLNYVLNGENKFCCLCFKTDQNFSFHDKLSIEINETGQNIPITDIFQSLFGSEMQEYLATFENICEYCLERITGIYTFLQTCHANATLLINSVNGLNNSVIHTNEDKKNSISLFVALNLKDFSSKHLYDSKKLDSTKAALQRLSSLNASRTRKLKKKELLLKTKYKTKHNIKISEMLLDPNSDVERRCKICSKSYKSNWNLKKHFSKVHAEKNYECPKCSNAFGSPSLVHSHINENHRKIICCKCGKTLKNRNSLLKHEIGHHQKIICPDCGRTYKSKITYKNHIEFKVCEKQCRANPANAKFTCDYCGKKYTQKMSLRVHIQYEHGNYKAHVCKWCGKKFWAHSRLKAHIVKHTGEKKFTCSYCQGKFVTKESLLYHTRLHTGEKPYKCSQCECTFISTSRRAQHLKTYHLGATAECETCHAKFTSHIYLDKHKKCHKQLNNENKNNDETKMQSINGIKSKNENKLRKKVKIISEIFIPKNSNLEDIIMPSLISEHNVQIHNQNFSQSYNDVFMANDSGDNNNLSTILGI